MIGPFSEKKTWLYHRIYSEGRGSVIFSQFVVLFSGRFIRDQNKCGPVFNHENHEYFMHVFF